MSRDETIRLLLVDDEEGFREAIARRLGKRGFVTAQASCGEECLEVLGRRPMDVVILDVKMPGMSGIDTLKAIKQQYDRVQVILLTGNVAISDGIEGIKAGAFDYLTKPVEIDHLSTKINQAFDIIRLEDEHLKETEYRTRLEKKMVDSERLMSLGTMSTGIAHEINNPLAIINESAGFMKELLQTPKMAGFAGKEALLMAIEKIEQSIKRARNITHQLLGHVKKQDSQLARVNLETLLQDTLDLLKKELENKQIAVLWNLDKQGALLWSDPYLLRQVFINLLNNSIHAMKEKGSITLSLGSTAGDIILEIQDTGMGIAQENLGKIFDPFFTTKSFDEGTGLGLFVVHKILSDLNGKIEVESTLGKGTTVTITLPKGSSQNHT